MIPADIISHIRESIDIADVIKSKVVLKSIGDSHIGLCPFHQEKSASFHVYSKKQPYHCFGCGAHGDIFRFFMVTENLSFIQSVTHVAEFAGLRHLIPTFSKKNDSSLDRIYFAYKIALSYFRKNLQLSSCSTLAYLFIDKRGLSPSVVEHFQLGYATDAWDGLRQELTKEGISETEAIEWGLLNRSTKDGSKIFDTFRNRFIFPIFDYQNRPVAFGGRRLIDDPQSPKYINSKTTNIYTKGDVLFGYNQAINYIKSEKSVIIVEGYIDQISLFQHGIKNVVACLGTALTINNIRKILQICSTIILVFDGDEAGQKAAEKNISTLLESSADVRVVTIPDSLDPDDFVKKFGKSAFLDLLNQSLPIFSFLLKRKMKEKGLSQNGIIDILSLIIPVMVNVKDGVKRQFLMQEASSTLNVDLSALKHEVRHRIMAGGQEKMTAVAAHVVQLRNIQVSERLYLELLSLLSLNNIDVLPEDLENIINVFDCVNNDQFYQLFVFVKKQLVLDGKVPVFDLDLLSFLQIEQHIINEFVRIHSINQKRYLDSTSGIHNNIMMLVYKIQNSKFDEEIKSIKQEFLQIDFRKRVFLTIEHEQAYKNTLIKKLEYLTNEKNNVNIQLSKIKEINRTNFTS